MLLKRKIMPENELNGHLSMQIHNRYVFMDAYVCVCTSCAKVDDITNFYSCMFTYLVLFLKISILMYLNVHTYIYPYVFICVYECMRKIKKKPKLGYACPFLLTPLFLFCYQVFPKRQQQTH